MPVTLTPFGLDSRYVNVSGDTMTGALVISASGTSEFNGDVLLSSLPDAEILATDSLGRIIEGTSTGNFQGVLSSPPSGPQSGWTYVNSSDNGYYIYFGGTWQLLHTLTPSSPPTGLSQMPIGLLLCLTYPTDSG